MDNNEMEVQKEVTGKKITKKHLIFFVSALLSVTLIVVLFFNFSNFVNFFRTRSFSQSFVNREISFAVWNGDF